MNQHYIYTFVCFEEERSLCHLEMRSFFGEDSEKNMIKSQVKIDPSRSPFMKERIAVIFEGETVEDIVQQAASLHLGTETFRIDFAKVYDGEYRFKERIKAERDIGWVIEGEADLKNPDRIFGIIPFEGRWYFGEYAKSEAIWLRHLKKPREYSTALSTRVARTCANIAVPHPEGKKAIDPCCGIGTVLVEARSMGIDMVGRDINPLVTDGSRENLAYFGLEGEVTTGPISEVEELYDAAIIDLPYNLFTKATPEDQFSILKEARRFSSRTVIISTDLIDEMIQKAGFEIVDRCVAKKSSFIRHIMVCI
ncbi:TRM11 family SAM-dependent methyltransferase [Peribacillus kribbensis]|uniref:TRM11 family SAM-dependent methyltransferase n=1 Tax=Peribacillus kribbensis TaxID=356658 RepID=UPI00041063BE|nr:RNA methyltransferase [Peribacillus kribbensis]